MAARPPRSHKGRSAREGFVSRVLSDARLLGGGPIGEHALTVRPAAPHDAGAMGRHAVIAGRPRPSGHALLAEEHGAPVAAIALTTGALFADPLLPPKA